MTIFIVSLSLLEDWRFSAGGPSARARAAVRGRQASDGLVQLTGAGQDLQEHLVDHVLGRAAAAEVDLGEGVEEPLVAEAEALVAKRQRGAHRTHRSSSSSRAARQ
ncbi:hypothetical protein OHA61_38470 [Streptomyces sp. NBC_00885]|uniref:hypothetical protein n=1 Tax=Streptomyces sp. NBC_00885 TaxID=2975857 RepID=UPI00386BF030|nr:hypothetical protein OHA61_38470 [Streptomyces sp. NBC_00885]